uniref:E1 ubiquitin-activating enzyme n=1 Tax=Parascaris univalens TaxID=6257 RepID=A0A915CCS0_PARUN
EGVVPLLPIDYEILFVGEQLIAVRLRNRLHILIWFNLMSSAIAANQTTVDFAVAEPAKKRARVHEAAADSQEANQAMRGGVEKMELNQSLNGTSSRLMSGGATNARENVLDHNLYSRQIYALGESAMMHLRRASVLISGIGAVGVEIAKNLILGGVRHVTIHDTQIAQWLDLSAQYYLREDDLGCNRAKASFERLAELNDSVVCKLNTEPLTEDFVKQFDLVVLTDASMSLQLKVNEWTRAHNRRMLVADARGLFAFVFLDVGNEFRIDDPNGEQCKEVLIEHIDRETGDVMTLESVMHGFEDGDFISFAEVRGMDELNHIDAVQITVKSPHIFNIGSVATKFSEYVEGGRATQVKRPKYVTHSSLAESVRTPQFLIWDFAKLDHPPQLHALWQALYKFGEKYGRRPAPRCDADVELLKKEVPADSEVDAELLKMFSYQASGNLVAIASVIGGIAAQEAMKAVTHHMTPLQQYLYVDCLEALHGSWSPFDASKLTMEDCRPRNCRYDGQIAVFGEAYQKALMKQKFFVVGAGAIGCELLKNLAMMGAACDKSGEGVVKITDMDQIEISNLNRQFLFRRNDVRSKKSEVAARAVLAFNADLNIEALSERVGPDTESIFTDNFFDGLNCVLNALDNLDARRYMDRRCVYYRLPLLESGTMGTKGNVQVVYPHLTESYGSSADPPEKDIPICTLKNFPNEIQHTIQWARELFEGLFTNPAETVNQFLSDERAFLERVEHMNVHQRIQVLDQVKRALVDDKPQTAKDCIKWARLLFQENFHNVIAQLLHTFPPDQMTSQGVKFWSGSKRCPHVLQFDAEKEEHFNFIYAASILRAQQYNIEPILDKKEILDVLSNVKPEPFLPKSGVKIAVTEAEAKEQDELNEEDADTQISALKIRLAKLNTKALQRLTPIDFEKDDDSNHHMEFITAASNLRAENYDIQPADRMKTKQIAGRIIPAIATTTATVAGLVCVELHKMIGDGSEQLKVPLDRFKNGFLNMALPFFAFSDPIAAAKKKYHDQTFTLWDRLEIQGPKSLKELIDWIQEQSKLEVSMLSSGVSLIYSFFMSSAKRAERMNQDVRTVVEEVSRRRTPAYARSLVLEVMATDSSDEDVEIPYIKYNF